MKNAPGQSLSRWVCRSRPCCLPVPCHTGHNASWNWHRPAPDPELLLLDEPTAGLASEQVPELMALIQNIQLAGNKTVMLVEHNMNVVMNFSDRITVMHHGAV